TKGTGWHDPRIVPYEPLTLDPAAITFHYGQTVFEGLKAYRTKDNEVQLFRPEKNFIRMNHSNDRLVIPHIDEDFAVEDRKSTRLNSSHVSISYAVFCLKKKIA